MSEAQARRAHKLAKKECCNCFNGFCVLFDSPCPQCITRSLVCKWFIRSVLPADVPLYVELTGNRGKSKPCAAGLRRPRRIDAVEALENPFHLFRRHSYPVVLHRNLSHSAAPRKRPLRTQNRH